MVRSNLLLFSIILLLAAFLLGVLNISKWLDAAREDVQISAYIDNGDQANRLIKQITSLEGIAEVLYISKEMALKEFKETYVKSDEYLEGLDSNPLPESFKVSLKKEYVTNEQIKKLVDEINSFNGVADVIYEEGTVQRIDTFVKYFPYFALAIGGLLLIMSLTMLYSRTNLRFILKGNEIRIMKFIGAAPLSIIARFVVIEFLEGIIISGISILCVYGIYRFLINENVLSLSFFPPKYWVGFIVFWGLCSITISYIKTYISTRQL